MKQDRNCQLLWWQTGGRLTGQLDLRRMKKKNQVLYKKKQVTGFSKNILKKNYPQFYMSQIYFAVIFCDLHSELIQFDSLREGEIESISNHIFWLCLRNMDEKSTKSTFGFKDAYSYFLPYSILNHWQYTFQKRLGSNSYICK